MDLIIAPTLEMEYPEVRSPPGDSQLLSAARKFELRCSGLRAPALLHHDAPLPLSCASDEVTFASNLSYSFLSTNTRIRRFS